ncbi:serglycin [Pleuronectes platessa]|uniref:serglycin n=1 Tax=Pleuronectes platessa TaxID=8262 RepID=UPI00232A5246|nr:serglycin [Pleuronectes platessa]
MKVFLLLIVSCLAVHNGEGAPRSYVYKFLKCNPDGNQANCVTQETPVRPWREDLPDKLPSSTAQYLEAVPVEDERPPREEGEGELPVISGESPQPEEGSAGYEGSASEWPFVADRAFASAESETGSGESWTKSDMDLYKGGDKRSMRWLLPSRSVVGEAKPDEQELRDDHLLQL